ncbi:FtsH protease activity modulator HflK [Opitutales bacterium ASA1]|uniref:SPFH domain-containing protein n=1 Tax=Congregicoccus parvus TaxID=3081749 RepID=UPI002B284FEF|nr:FtsH protease activity modulator HflK [Opitutales bacterium ASA1]
MNEAKPGLKRDAGAAEGADLELVARRTLRLTALLFAAVTAWYLTSGVHFVAAGESALVLRLGKLQPRVHGPGLLVAFPEPVDRVVRFATGGPRELVLEAWQAREAEPSTDNETEYGPVRHRLDPRRDGYTLTGDANIVQGSFTLRYQIVDTARHFTSVREPERLLEAVFHQAATRALARVAIDDVVPTGLAVFRDATLEAMKEILAEIDPGVTFTGLELRELLPPKPVLPAFQDVSSARVEAKTYVDEALALRERMRRLADAESHALRAAADAEAAARLQRARGESEAFSATLEAAREEPGRLEARLLAEVREEVWPKLGRGAVAAEDAQGTILWRPQGVDTR